MRRLLLAYGMIVVVLFSIMIFICAYSITTEGQRHIHQEISQSYLNEIKYLNEQKSPINCCETIISQPPGKESPITTVQANNAC